MKKIFTSISMALCLAASSFNASAQQATQLSDAQKQEIQQKVLPVVFEQIKEQAGIDILGWAQPKLTADYLGSLPGFSALKSDNGLRAANDINVQPDSIKLDVTKLSSDPMLASLLGELTVKFVNPQTRTIPMIGMLLGYDVKIGVPEEIKVVSSVLQEVATIGITMDGKDGDIQPFTMDMTLSLFGADPINLLGYSCVQNSETSLLELNVEIKDEFRNLWSSLSSSLGDIELPSLPDSNYMITVNLAGIFTGQLAMSLYGLPLDGGNQVPMGDAVVAIDMAALQGGMPIQYIDITSYEGGTANDWSRLVFDMSQANAQDLVLTINNIGYANADKENATVRSIINITMTDNTVNVTNPQSAAQAVIQNVVSQLANEGEVAPYAMAIEMIAVDTNGDGIINGNDNVVSVMDVTVTPSLSATGASATINIKSYSGESTTEVDLIATATTEKVQLDVEMGGSVIGSAYFTSNILEATSNEDIQLANVEVTPVKDGIYVSGTTAASYRIVSMSGAIVANGTVSGDNAYISTSALAKGIYVIVVTENGESKAIKFAR